MSMHLSRRTVLRGLGTALALPWLEAMARTNVLRASPAQPPLRVAFVYVANGMHMPDWTPASAGELTELPPIMQPIADFRRHVTVLSGLALDGGRAHGDGPGDHARSVASFLTGAHPRKTNGANIENGVSVDQFAAEKVGARTRFASLELGCEASATAGNCDSGYSCAYTSNISWRTPTTPVAKEINPRAVFDRLFGSGDGTEEGKSRALRDRRRKSILDFVQEDARALQQQLGAADRRKLDEYLFSVRDVERRLAGADQLPGQEQDVADYPRPAGVPRDYLEHLRLMFDMLALAWQTDSTRIVSFMYTNDSSNRSYPAIGIREGHHELSHHGRNKEKQAKISRINTLHMEQFAYLLRKLESVREGDGTLLDHSLVMYGSGLADGDAHAHHDLPIMLVGQGGGSVRAGRSLRFAKDTPLCNLYLSLLERLGAKAEKFGDSTGRLEGLAS